MKYLGSKNRIAKEILPIILKNRKDNQYFVDVFAGGFNLIDKVDGLRMANDINYYLIEMFKALQNGWVPPKEVSEQLYKNIQNNKDRYIPALVGYVGFSLSFGGKFFGGYRRDSLGVRDYADEAFRSILKQIPALIGIEIHNKNYYELEIPNSSVIYCDPPYQGTTKYKNSLDYDYFWNWAREKSTDNHQVFISEYNAPTDFKCIWQKEVNNTLVKNTGSKKGIERLFIYEN